MMSRRERTIAIVAGVVIGALALDQLLITPLWTRLQEAEARLDVAMQESTTAQQLFQNELRARRKWKEMAGTTLQQQASQAESQLLNQVRDWAQQSGMTLTSIKPERVESQQGYQRITLRATGAGGMDELGEFLYAMQQAAIPVRLADITVASRQEGTDDLTIQMGLSTIYLPQEKDGAVEVTR